MSSGFLHTLASLATHWRTRRLSRAPPSLRPLRHRSLLINGKGSDTEDGSGGVPRPLHARLALGHTSHSTGDTNPQSYWRFGWNRSQCITVAQLRTGHCPLLASYLHHIGRQQSPACPHWRRRRDCAASSTLLPITPQAQSSTNYINSTDPRCMWSFLESIGAVTRPPTGNEGERGPI